MAQGTTELVQWIVDKYEHAKKEEGHRGDGMKPKQLADMFKRAFYHELHCALAAGIGTMIAFAGTPRSKLPAKFMR